ncbi:hypothetical protein PYCCODRAFT_1425067 [Trametes coccinea BRFM310]|uniref:NYN domain-containing protein n=1 Tax=Trametes coccinea (strain BRFM310) TaxID=1353009 RepID=A0A1Y2IRI6_TRAC3|nr:hypothetical protein PYCCODRAFT_1425067 [Trametes coccinea BRFM310]
MSVLSSTVAVFWDYDSCALPSAESTYSVVAKIRRLAHQYGSAKTFKAYVQHPEQPTLKTMTLRSELQSCGISLVDCLPTGRKDAADKMMLAVDMMAHAIDTPPPATIILISGDRVFAYAVSTLSFRQYKIVLVAPGTADAGLKGQADVVYTWPADFLSFHSAATPSSTSAVASREEQSRNPDPVDLQDNSRKQQPTPSSTMSSRMLVDLAENTFFASMMEPTRSTSPPPSATEAAPNPKDEAPSIMPASAALPTRPPSSVTSVAAGKAPAKAEPQFLSGVAAAAATDPVAEEGEITQSPFKVPTPSVPLRPSGIFSSWGTFSSPSTWTAKGPEVDPQSWSSGPSSSAWATEDQGNTQASSSWLLNGSRPPTSLRSAAGTSTSSPSFGHIPASSSSRVAPRAAPTDDDDGDDNDGEWETHSHVAKKARPNPGEIPAEFRPLVKVLKRQITAGVFRVESSQLGTLLSAEGGQPKAIYERAGVSQLKEYTAKAAELGVVKLSKPSPNGHNFIMLHPAHRRKP